MNKRVPNKLSVAGKVSAFVTLAWVTGIASSYAQIVPVNTNTQVTQQNKVDVVAIATPNAAGLSHNQYDQFNVSKAGTVLNNSQVAGVSQLAGQLQANSHLQNGAAKVILNEVVSRNPSLLLGKQEVFGMAADYVLANPNGITCNGCGFINVPRASLVVGKPELKNDMIDHYNVTGSNALTLSGNIDTARTQVVDLIAPKVVTSGKLASEKEINVIVGQNQVGRDNTVTQLANAQAKGQEVVYDGKIAGSMQSGRIRIHSTAGVDIEATQLTAQNVDITANTAFIHGKITTQENSSQYDHLGDASNHFITEKTSGYTQTHEGNTFKADNVQLNVDDDLVLKSTNITAKDVVINAGQAQLGSEKTSSDSVKTVDQTKGLWFNNQTDETYQESVHRDEITATNSLAINSTKGTTQLEAVKVDAGAVSLSGKKGVDVHGAVERGQETTQLEFKNETAQLKTGHANKDVNTENYVGTQITTVGDLLINAQGDVTLKGATANVGGTVGVKTPGKTIVGTEVVTNKATVDDYYKVWGGLGGSNTQNSDDNKAYNMGSDLQAKEQILIDADKGVSVSGSRVLAQQGGVVQASNGQLVIDSVTNKDYNHQYNRLGTIFNITKDENSKTQDVKTVVGSELRSETNLDLASKEGVRIEASTVKAAQKLGIKTLGSVDIVAAQNTSTQDSSSAGFDWNFTIDKPTLNNVTTPDTSKDVSVADVIDTAIDVSEKVQAVKDGKDLAEVTGAEQSVNLGLNIHKTSSSQTTTTHTGSELSGGTVDISTPDQVNLQGSKVASTQGDVNVNAKKVDALAVNDSTSNHTVATNATVGVTGTLNSDGVTVKLGIDVDHQDHNDAKTVAKGSQIESANDVNINAASIKHQGSEVTAKGDIHQNAKQITQEAASNTSTSDHKDVNVTVGASVTVGEGKALSGSVGVEASGSGEKVNDSTAVVSKLDSQNIHEDAQTIKDEGTQYTAKKDVVITSTNHEMTAATDTHSLVKNEGHGKLGVSGSTSDMQTAKLSVDVGAGYQHTQEESSKAVKGSITGDNIKVVAKDTLTSSADMTAKDKLDLQAGKKLNLVNASNTESTKKGGFDLNLGVGAIVVPEAGAAIPSVDTDLSVNYQDSHASTGVASQLTGDSVSLKGKEQANLKGTNVTATKDLVIDSAKTTVSGVESHSKLTSVDVNAGVGIGANLSDAKFDSGLAVKREESTQTQVASVKSPDLDITGKKGIDLSATKLEGQNVSLHTDGTLDLEAAKNETQKTNGGFTLGLSGGVSDQKWTPSGGYASVNAEIVRNHDVTPSTIQSDKVNLDVGKDVNMNASVINAKQVKGHVDGTLTSTQATTQTNEFVLDVGASGSGKPVKLTSENAKTQLKTDWNQGSILGVKGDAHLTVERDKQKGIADAGIYAKEQDVHIQNVTNSMVDPSLTEDSYFKVVANANTNIKGALAQVKKGYDFSKNTLINFRLTRKRDSE